MSNWPVEQSPLGRIVLAPDVPARFALFYTTRDFPGFLDPKVSAEIAAMIANRFGIEAVLATCVQVHGTRAAHAIASQEWRECDSRDALWSDEKEVALGIKVADCLPVTMIDPAHDVVANIHSGWRGAARGIVAATLATLRSSTTFDPTSASVWLGPSIRVCCFEVGDEVVDEFRVAYGDAAGEFIDRTRGPKAHIDLPSLTTSILRSAGFAAERIHDSQSCTRCEDSIFHSYRRGANGRNLAIVAQ